jgi:hypothetical protein
MRVSTLLLLFACVAGRTLSLKAQNKAQVPTIQVSVGWLRDNLSIDDLGSLWDEINQVFEDSGCKIVVLPVTPAPEVFPILDGRVDLAQRRVGTRVQPITTDQQRLARIPVNAKVVEQIKRCGGQTTKEEFLGCTGQGSGWITVIKDVPTPLRGAVWSHELIHSLGLPDVDEPGNLMNRAAGEGNRSLNTRQCAEIRANINKTTKYRLGARGLVLAVTTGQSPSHSSAPGGLNVIAELGRDSGLWRTIVSSDTGRLTLRPQSGVTNLNAFDAVVFRTSDSPPLTLQQRQDLLNFIRKLKPVSMSGRGFLGIHSAIDSYDGWKEYSEMLGGRFISDFPRDYSATVKVDAPDFPAMKSLGDRFQISDRVARVSGFSPSSARLLAHIDPVAGEPLVPIAWAKEYGQGRVFYSNIGHNDSVLRQQAVRAMYLEAMKWILGYADADTSPAGATGRP